jgi:hypothetical protein
LRRLRDRGLTTARAIGWRLSPRGIALAALWSVFLGRLVVAAAILPPWQNPDEPSHFAVIRTFALDPAERTSAREALVEAEILASMARYQWWERYDEPTPDPLPSQFAQVTGGHLSRPQFGEPALYYTLGAQYCNLLGVESPIAQYAALRIASLVLSALAFGVILRAAREWFNARIALYTGALIALVPQFAIIGITVSPEPIVTLAGALVWWQAARAVSGKKFVVPVAAMIAAGVVALLAKRGGAPVIVQAGAFTVAAIGAAVLYGGRGRVVLGVLLASITAAAGVLLLGRPNELAKMYDWWEWMVLRPRESAASFGLAFFFAFTNGLLGSAYLAAGWLRYWAPPAVYIIAGITGAFGFVRGVVHALAFDARLRRGALFALLCIAIQLSAIYGTRLYAPGSGIQGRFLFAAIGPIAALTAVGLSSSTSRWLPRVVAPVAIGLLAVLDLVSWVTTVIPVYVR